MRKSSRRRQKTRSSWQVETNNRTDPTPQYFQITVNVIEAKKLAWYNSQSPSSYVVIVLGKMKHRTNIKQNMADPCFKESFVFDMYATTQELQRSYIWLTVKEPRCCAPPLPLGEAIVNLGVIWAQPNHKVSNKWAQLTLPQDPSASLVGFLRVDISITLREDVQTSQIMPIMTKESHLDDDILLPSGMEQTRANYMITIYGAFALPSGQYSYGDRRYGKPPNTFVRVSFCGLTANTGVQNRNSWPSYNEIVSIVEIFPNVNQKISFEVCSTEGCFNRVLASSHLRLDLISHDGENGFLPTFGPSLLHMYGTSSPGSVGYAADDGPSHRGALLVALKTVVPFYQHELRTINIEPALPIKTKNLWLFEDFCVFCPILEVSLLDRRIVGKSCGVAVTIGEIFSSLKGNDQSRKLHYTGSLDVTEVTPVYGCLDFPHGFPVLQLVTRLPDIRFRMYRNNMVHGIVSTLESTMTDVDHRLQSHAYAFLSELLDDLNKAIEGTIGNILKFLDILQYSGSDVVQQYSTELDLKQLSLQKDEMEKMCNHLSREAKTCSLMSLGTPLCRGTENDSVKKKTVKILLAECKILMENLRSLIFKSPDGWPDVVLWLLNAGSRVAYCKISPPDIIYSVIPEQNGRECGRIQTIYFKPLNCPKHQTGVSSACDCITGKAELLFWMGQCNQSTEFDKCLPTGYNLRIRENVMALECSSFMMLECRCFLYRAKLNMMENQFPYSFVRMHALCSVTETKIKQKNPAPIWNEVLKIRKMMSITQERLSSFPPLVLIEVYGREISGNHELLGRIEVEPTFEDRQVFEYAPKLQWHDVRIGKVYVGQVLMSVQIVQIPEKIMKTIVYSSLEETYVDDMIEFCGNDSIITLPACLIPESRTYKVDIYWWGLRDVNIARKPCVILETDELIMKSDVISVTKPNCNFTNGRMSQVFEAPLNEPYCPPLNIKLYDSNTFGRTSFIGVHVIKNPNKYLINWISLSERRSLVNVASITSSKFVQVTQTLCLMKQQPSNDETNIAFPSIKSNQSTTKMSVWRRLFCRKVPDEEEYVLLPILSTEKNQNELFNKKSLYRKDWWHRYYNTVKIYSSELESQPEFSKFKDWCATLKFYNGMKSGIPEKDDQRYCGSLKAGIAIYKWPRTLNTDAVSVSGVDLTKSYFADHPYNDVIKFLVRVYIIKGVNLQASNLTGKSDAYVIVSCGKNLLGERNNYVSNTANPTFGELFEFRCTIPDEYVLTVSLFDYEAALPDDLIGKTTIDLENRIYSKHRARVGLSSEYNLTDYKKTGISKWRDLLKPSAILEEVCMKNHLAAPTYPDCNTVVVNGVEYKDQEMHGLPLSGSKEKICLSILHKWHTLPLCGYHLVPEHVETRTLYNPDKPGVVQGQLQMWVDIFQLGSGVSIPRPVDITPRVEEFELRVTVFGVDLDNNKLNNVGDIYVMGWIGCVDQTQSTDVYSGRIKGEARFNLCLIFEFLYKRAENMLILKDKGQYNEFQECFPPILVLRVIDCDKSSSNLHCGILNLNLNAIPHGDNLPQDCSLHKAEHTKKINLFDTESIRAWWPLETIDNSTGNHLNAGAIGLEMMLLPKEKAILMPVGRDRGPSFSLPESTCCRTTFCKILSKYIFGISSRCLKLLLVMIVVLILIFLMFFFKVPVISFGYWFSDVDLLPARRTVGGLYKI